MTHSSSSGADCRLRAGEVERRCVLPGGGPVSLGDSCKGRLPGHVHAGPDDPEGIAGRTHPRRHTVTEGNNTEDGGG